jgi:Dynamin GTPase effector domain
MENQIKMIRNHLALYMRIFTKKYLDSVPKKISYHVVNGIIDYVRNKLFDVLVTSADLVSEIKLTVITG